MLDYRRQQPRKDNHHENNVSVEKNASTGSARSKGVARHTEEDVEELHLNILDNTRYVCLNCFAANCVIACY